MWKWFLNVMKTTDRPGNEHYYEGNKCVSLPSTAGSEVRAENSNSPILGDETKLPFKSHCLIQMNQTNVTFQVAKIVKGKNLPRRQDSPSPKYGEGPRAYV